MVVRRLAEARETRRHVERGPGVETEMAMACVFNPPLYGHEIHDETGAYPPGGRNDMRGDDRHSVSHRLSGSSPRRLE